MRILVDSNVILPAIQHDNRFCDSARSALKRLPRQGHVLCLTPQNVREFRNVCTRPVDRNGLGIGVSGAERHTRLLERYFEILPDSLATYNHWRQLVVEHQVLGAKVHDAWLVAAMKTNAIERVLTFNAADFARYGGIRVIDPASLAIDNA